MSDFWNLAQISLNLSVSVMKGSGNKLTLFEIGVRKGLSSDHKPYSYTESKACSLNLLAPGFGRMNIMLYQIRLWWMKVLIWMMEKAVAVHFFSVHQHGINFGVPKSNIRGDSGVRSSVLPGRKDFLQGTGDPR